MFVGFMLLDVVVCSPWEDPMSVERQDGCQVLISCAAQNEIGRFVVLFVKFSVQSRLILVSKIMVVILKSYFSEG